MDRRVAGIAKDLPDISDVFAAHSLLHGVIRTTPVFFWAEHNVYLKVESLQKTGSFKLRGAFTLLKDPAFQKGVVTASSGNHGSALAYAASCLGISACVVMPEDAPAVKVSTCRRYGARVVLWGTTSPQRQEKAQALAGEWGWAYAESYDHPRIIAGQGTVGLELLQQLRGLKQVVCPIGGGGLISGVAVACKSLAPHVKIVGVEPAGAARMTRSLATGHREVVPKVRTIADGLRVSQPGTLTFPLIQKGVDQIVTVSDGDIRQAMGALFYEQKLVVEPSGAATVAALLAGHLELCDKTALVLSGGNIDASLLAELVENNWQEGMNATREE